MDLIVWSENYEVNIKPIDEQHQEMAKTVNELYSLLDSNKNEETKYLVQKLLDEIKVHFDTEEKLMRDGKFNSYITHKLEHERFEKDFENHYNKFLNGETEVDLRFLKLFKRWFINHIEINDKKLGVHINSLDNKEELLNQFDTN